MQQLPKEISYPIKWFYDHAQNLFVDRNEINVFAGMRSQNRKHDTKAVKLSIQTFRIYRSCIFHHESLIEKFILIDYVTQSWMHEISSLTQTSCLD